LRSGYAPLSAARAAAKGLSIEAPHAKASHRCPKTGLSQAPSRPANMTDLQ
jgi:hypothetical protein